MHALIDTDILCYEMGSLKFPDTGNPLPWPIVRDRIDLRIEQIQLATEASSWEGFLTGKGNFRDEIATIRPYKGNRVRADRPFWYQAVYLYLVNERNCTVIEGSEADDAIASLAGEGSIICSKDKDLLQVPGWHYTWSVFGQEEKTPFFITEVEGLRNFYKQLLTGDSTDNILGLYGVGTKSTLVKKLDELTTELEMFEHVYKQYQDRFGSYCLTFMIENGSLLWLVRNSNKFEWTDRALELTFNGKDNKKQGQQV